MFSRQVIRFGCSAGYRGGWARLWAGIGTGIEVRLHGSLNSNDGVLELEILQFQRELAAGAA